MKIFILAVFLTTTQIALAETTFTIVNTGTAKSLDILSTEGGGFHERIFNHAAFVIRHNDKTILFETGIGQNIREEFDQSMPFWAKPFFQFEYIKSLKQQLPSTHFDQIYLSHLHWDHTGGLSDNLGSNPYISQEEFEELSKEHLVTHRTFMIHLQNHSPKSFSWKNAPYLDFNKHYDLFNDGKVIIVPLPGHSFGSIGMILNGEKDKYFFVGDAIWVESQLNGPVHKSYLASMVVDRDKKGLSKTMDQIKTMRDKHHYQIIPTHDSAVHNRLGYFPTWVAVP